MIKPMHHAYLAPELFALNRAHADEPGPAFDFSGYTKPIDDHLRQALDRGYGTSILSRFKHDAARTSERECAIMHAANAGIDKQQQCDLPPARTGAPRKQTALRTGAAQDRFSIGNKRPHNRHALLDEAAFTSRFDGDPALTEAGRENIENLASSYKCKLNGLFKWVADAGEELGKDCAVLLRSRLIACANQGALRVLGRALQTRQALRDFLKNWETHRRTLDFLRQHDLLESASWLPQGRGLPRQHEVEALIRSCTRNGKLDTVLFNLTSSQILRTTSSPKQAVDARRGRQVSRMTAMRDDESPSSLKRQRTESDYLKRKTPIAGSSK